MKIYLLNRGVDFVAHRELAHHKQFLLLLQCFHESSTADLSECNCMGKGYDIIQAKQKCGVLLYVYSKLQTVTDGTFSNTWEPFFHLETHIGCIRSRQLLKTLWQKGEFSHDEQFYLLPQCFQIYSIIMNFNL